MHIEPLQESDFLETTEIIRAAFFDSIAPTWSENAIDTFLENDLSIQKLGGLIATGFTCLKAVRDQEIIGVQLFSSDSKLAHLFVKPSEYGNGIASALFLSAKEVLVQKNTVEYIELTSTETAVVIYEKLGFKKSARPFRYNGCIFQPMVYWLGNDRLKDKVEFINW